MHSHYEKSELKGNASEGDKAFIYVLVGGRED